MSGGEDKAAALRARFQQVTAQTFGDAGVKPPVKDWELPELTEAERRDNLGAFDLDDLIDGDDGGDAA